MIRAALAGSVAGLIAAVLCMALSNAFHIGVGEEPIAWLWPGGVCYMMMDEASTRKEVLAMGIASNMVLFALIFAMIAGGAKLLRRFAKR